VFKAPRIFYTIYYIYLYKEVVFSITCIASSARVLIKNLISSVNAMLKSILPGFFAVTFLDVKNEEVMPTSSDVGRIIAVDEYLQGRIKMPKSLPEGKTELYDY
jgi:hypothetical protein